MTVVRLNSADGSRDASFGNNGVVTIDFGNADRAIDLAIDEQNIFVCGFAVKTATDSDFGVARLNRSNGSLNNAFDGDGKVTVDFFGKQDGAQAIILGGPIPAANATNGVIETNDVDEPHIIVGGNATNTTAEDFAVAALDFKGNLIPTLFNQGKDTVDFNGGRDLLFGLINQPDGDIVADGWAGDGANFDLGMTKWKAGSLDLGFGVQGEYTLDTASGGNNVAFDGVINGVNIVTAGVGLNPITGNDDFVVTLHENEIFVEFTKTASPDPAVEGDLITYTFTIKNLTDTAIEVIIADSLSFRVSFDSARNPFWISTGTSARTNPIPVRSLETKEFTLAVRAMKSGLASNKGRLLSKDGRQFFAQDEVLHQITRAKVTDVTRDRKNLRVTMNSTGTNQSSTIAPNAIEPQASCPVVLYDGVEQKTSRDPIIQQPC